MTKYSKSRIFNETCRSVEQNRESQTENGLFVFDKGIKATQ